MTKKRTKRTPPKQKRKQISTSQKSRTATRAPRKRASTRTIAARAALNRGSKPLRIFAKPQLGEKMARRIAAATPATGFDFAATLAGKTAHFQVYYQTRFANGPVIAQGVLTTCERDYNAQVAFFSGLAIPTLPVNILIGSGIGGAYHYGCAAVDLYCDGDSSANPDIDLTRMLVVAEEVEVFEARYGIVSCTARRLCNGRRLARFVRPRRLGQQNRSNGPERRLDRLRRALP
jgi:hypothetical protein